MQQGLAEANLLHDLPYAELLDALSMLWKRRASNGTQHQRGKMDRSEYEANCDHQMTEHHDAMQYMYRLLLCDHI